MTMVETAPSDAESLVSPFLEFHSDTGLHSLVLCKTSREILTVGQAESTTPMGIPRTAVAFELEATAFGAGYRLRFSIRGRRVGARLIRTGHWYKLGRWKGRHPI